MISFPFSFFFRITITLVLSIWSLDEVFGQHNIYVNEQFTKVAKEDAVAYSNVQMQLDKGTFYFLSMAEYDTLFITEMRRGKRNGAYTAFSVDGHIIEKGQFKRGKRRGWYHYYDYPEKLFRGVYYNWRNQIRAEFYVDQQGRKIYTEADRNSTFGKYRSEQRAVEALGQFVDQNLEKPSYLLEMDPIIVTVHLIIQPNGKIDSVHMSLANHPELEETLRKMIEKMPDWTPARFKGKNVYSEFYLSVSC